MKEREFKIKEAVAFIRARTGFQPEGGLILGTGLSSLTDNIPNGVIIPYQDIPGFPVSTAPSHRGQMWLGEFRDKKMLIMQGRFHYYEGYSMEQVTFPIRVMNQLGVKFLIITNAAGSLNNDMQPGDLVLLEDHINFMGTNPLIGEHDNYYGERFPSLNEPYSDNLRNIALSVAHTEGIVLKKGVYIAVSGPSLETKSECKTFANWGADVVGMSTVPEVIVGTQCGMQLLGISVVTNMSNLFHGEIHKQADIEKTAQEAFSKISVLIERIIEKI
ncbi:MAG: purine-nucleoside phosphorylase [Candidatus Cloacimonetes bacterium]|nr:purine-nucleoside phosphorylase [Candidatus Cloacimonadota bacterium]